MGDEEEGSENANENLKKRLHKLQQEQQLEMQKRRILRKLLEPEAYERIMIVRQSNEELYDQVVSTLAYLAQANKIGGKISEEQLKKLLTQLTAKRETKFEVKRK